MKKISELNESDFKPKFAERYKEICPDYERFVEYSFKFLRRSIRVNTLKISVEDLKKRLEKNWVFTPIPWCKEGFWIEHNEGRRDIGNLMEHVLGYIYIQEAASMIPPLALDPQPGELILDMCSAPGSKATQIAQYMQNKGLLVSNDYKGMRIKSLGINMQRMGVTNEIISLMEGRYFKDIPFDRILVDAPCSGTGTIRKSLKTINIWNPNMVRRLAATQRQLITTAFETLKPGGTMVYSTCSLEPEEDEAVVDYLLDQYDNSKLEKIDLDLKRSPVISEFDGNKFDSEIKKCIRLWPYENDTEGFFIAKIKKEK